MGFPQKTGLKTYFRNRDHYGEGGDTPSAVGALEAVDTVGSGPHRLVETDCEIGLRDLRRRRGDGVHLQQDGTKLTGTMEGGIGVGIPILMERRMAKSVYLKAGDKTYSDFLEGDQIELQHTVELGFSPAQLETPTGPRPRLDHHRMDRIRRGTYPCDRQPAFPLFCIGCSIE
jgi:hypothetical protein